MQIYFLEGFGLGVFWVHFPSYPVATTLSLLKFNFQIFGLKDNTFLF